MIELQNHQKILFIGDSITDCGRNRENPSVLGSGYVNMIANFLDAERPDLNLAYFNLGISGNRVKDLRARWSKDCIAYQPDLVSILIGINDVWRRYDSNDPTKTELFAEGYRYILQELQDKCKAQLVIIEPFVLPFPEDRKQWREDLDPKIAAIRELAMDFNAEYIPMDGIFAAACCRRHPEFWAGDGVHPSGAGHMLIAKSWLNQLS